LLFENGGQTVLIGFPTRTGYVIAVRYRSKPPQILARLHTQLIDGLSQSGRARSTAYHGCIEQVALKILGFLQTLNPTADGPSAQ